MTSSSTSLPSCSSNSNWTLIESDVCHQQGYTIQLAQIGCSSRQPHDSGVDVSPTRPSFASFASVLEEFTTFSDFLETKLSSPVVGDGGLEYSQPLGGDQRRLFGKGLVIFDFPPPSQTSSNFTALY